MYVNDFKNSPRKERVKKCICECGGGTGHEFYTVLGCGSASGVRLLSFIKGRTSTGAGERGGPAGTVYGVSDSGWMEGPNSS